MAHAGPDEDVPGEKAPGVDGMLLYMVSNGPIREPARQFKIIYITNG